MGMSPHIGDREKDKFVETDDGETAVRVQNTIVDDDGDEIEINTDGSVNIKALSIRSLLEEILVELKILNLHNQLATDHEITAREVIR